MLKGGGNIVWKSRERGDGGKLVVVGVVGCGLGLGRKWHRWGGQIGG